MEELRRLETIVPSMRSTSISLGFEVIDMLTEISLVDVVF